MGLDVSHDCWRGSYSAFNRWRNAVGEAAGYMLRKVQWGANPDPMDNHKYILLDWGRIESRHNFGEWTDADSKILNYDPLIPLLVHSDCEGIIAPAQAGPIADRLEELLPLIGKGKEAVGHIPDWQSVTQRFINGLRAAVAANENVEFC